MTQRISNPFPWFTDSAGLPLTGGFVYIGEPGEDPQTSPVAAYFDQALTIPAEQPIRTIGGMLSNDGNPAFVYVDGDNYSIRVRDGDGAEVFYVASALAAQTPYQPLDSDLTAIAALSTTPFGRQLLTIADAAAGRTYLGIVASLPLTGGAVTGNITRSGAGPHIYHADGALTSGRIFITANGAADPTSLPGDIWLEKSA